MSESGRDSESDSERALAPGWGSTSARDSVSERASGPGSDSALEQGSVSARAPVLELASALGSKRGLATAQNPASA